MNIGELCTSQAGFTDVPAEQIASSIDLTDAQKEELEKLKAASTKASDGLKASCPAAVPDTLDGRLDAAQRRVDGVDHSRRYGSPRRARLLCVADG